MKSKISEIFENSPNTVFFLNKDGAVGNIAFVAIKPIPFQGNFCCSNCGGRHWNASNLFNNIHFCENRELDVIFSPYFTVKVNIK